MRLTEHFTLEELQTTSTGIANECPADLFLNLKKCAALLEKARGVLTQAAGKDCYVIVKSCYRSQAVNAAIKGSDTSAHMKALGMDIVANPKLFNLRETFDVLRLHPTFMQEVDQMVIERGCVHLGLPIPEHNYIPRHELRLDVDINGKRHYPLWAIWPAEGKV